MYEEFYNLKKKPFSKTPDPEFLYLSKKHAEALARLQHAVEEREIMVLTGDIGTGKTTLSRALFDSLGEEYLSILILNPVLSPFQFLTTLARRLGIKEIPRSRNQISELIQETLFDLYDKNICPVILIDEAHLIPGKSTFDEIRLLTNFQLDETNLFSLILVGQPELSQRLKQPAYRALNQRFGLRYHLEPLTREETEEYMKFRLEKAGGDLSLFDERAIDVIYKYSGGIPRVINNIASSCLIEGFASESPVITSEIVMNVVRDLGLGD